MSLKKKGLSAIDKQNHFLFELFQKQFQILQESLCFFIQDTIENTIETQFKKQFVQLKTAKKQQKAS